MKLLFACWTAHQTTALRVALPALNPSRPCLKPSQGQMSSGFREEHCTEVKLVPVSHSPVSLIINHQCVKTAHVAAYKCR